VAWTAAAACNVVLAAAALQRRVAMNAVNFTHHMSNSGASGPNDQSICTHPTHSQHLKARMSAKAPSKNVNDNQLHKHRIQNGPVHVLLCEWLLGNEGSCRSSPFIRQTPTQATASTPAAPLGQKQPSGLRCSPACRPLAHAWSTQRSLLV
jgi:hypothetical protein